MDRETGREAGGLYNVFFIYVFCFKYTVNILKRALPLCRDKKGLFMFSG